MKCNKSTCHNYNSVFNNKKLLPLKIDLIFNKKQQSDKIEACYKRKHIEKLITILSKLSRFILLIHLLILLNYFEGVVALFLFNHKSATSSAFKNLENNGCFIFIKIIFLKQIIHKFFT